MQKQNIVLGASAIILDSYPASKILLIQREKNPYKDKWAFPGGKLEAGESINEAMEREVYEETGYKFKISDKNQLYNVRHIKGDQAFYVVYTGFGVLTDKIPNNINRNHNDLLIKSQFFSLSLSDQIVRINQLKEEDCIPGLFEILNKFHNLYKIV